MRKDFEKTKQIGKIADMYRKTHAQKKKIFVPTTDFILHKILLLNVCECSCVVHIDTKTKNFYANSLAIVLRVGQIYRK